MAPVHNRAVGPKRVFLSLIFVFELFVLVVMEIYKYFINFSFDGGLSPGFLKVILPRFNPFYMGNLFWLVLFILSLTAIVNLFLRAGKVNDIPIKVLAVFSVILTALLALSILINSTGIPAEQSGKFLQLNEKGTKVLSLSVFTVLKIFFTLSLCVISFSALKKYYVFRSVWLTLFLLAVCYAVVLGFVYFHRDDSSKFTSNVYRLDAGIVLGAAVWSGNRPSPVLRERINKCYELYRSGNIKYVVLTGGGSPGEMTEADVAKTELLKKGVDERFLIVENKSNSTLEQVIFVNNNLYTKNRWSGIVLITDNFHLMRSMQICSFFGINAFGVASEQPLSTESGFNYSMKEAFALILFWLFGIG